jgi:hypothetical protein
MGEIMCFNAKHVVLEELSSYRTMKVYCKTHRQQEYEVIAVCDENVLGESLGKQKISEVFYKGDLIEISEAINLLKNAQNFNIAGKTIINACIESGIISEQGIIVFENIPFAMKFLL